MKPPTPSRLEFYSDDSEAGYERFALPALGTENVLLLDPSDLGSGLASEVQATFDLVEQLEAKLSKFRSESEVSLANRLAARQAVYVGDEVVELVDAAREAWELTGGAFDPTTAKLSDLWGFTSGQGRVPSDEEIAVARTASGMDRIEIDRDEGTVRFRAEGVSLDFGGIGKGYIVDRLVEQLQESGVRSGAVLSGRSTIVVWGSPPVGERWRVLVAHPEEAEESLATIELEAGALSSSGASERFFQIGTETYGHIIDPRSGRPAKSSLSATVWSPDALSGDILSTSLFVLGASALGEGGCLRQFVTRWSGFEGRDPRATFLVSERDSGSWGGLSKSVVSVGEPGFREL
ncbi:MAG: FAD:protein FMN transferase [Planctomycetota bacterium]